MSMWTGDSYVSTKACLWLVMATFKYPWLQKSYQQRLYLLCSWCSVSLQLTVFTSLKSLGKTIFLSYLFTCVSRSQTVKDCNLVWQEELVQIHISKIRDSFPSEVDTLLSGRVTGHYTLRIFHLLWITLQGRLAWEIFLIRKAQGFSTPLLSA